MTLSKSSPRSRRSCQHDRNGKTLVRLCGAAVSKPDNNVSTGPDPKWIDPARILASALNFGGIPVFINPDVPLTSTKKDGRVVDAVAWRFGDSIHVHPDRMAQFQRMFFHDDEAIL